MRISDWSSDVCSSDLCCGQWVEHMREAGFTVEVRNTNNLNPVKARLGVPYGKGSCHTAEVGGYVVEGHVPADDVKRLLARQLEAKGLVVPGMPLEFGGAHVCTPVTNAPLVCRLVLETHKCGSGRLRYQ